MIRQIKHTAVKVFETNCRFINDGNIACVLHPSHILVGHLENTVGGKLLIISKKTNMLNKHNSLIRIANSSRDWQGRIEWRES